MLCTTHLFGVLADQYGRRYIVMRCNLMSSILTLVTAFCPNFLTISAVTFLNGAVYVSGELRIIMNVFFLSRVVTFVMTSKYLKFSECLE